MAAYGLYTHITANKTRSMLLLGGLFVLMTVVWLCGYALLAARDRVLDRGHAEFQPGRLVSDPGSVVRLLVGLRLVVPCDRLWLR